MKQPLNEYAMLTHIIIGHRMTFKFSDLVEKLALLILQSLIGQFSSL